MKPTNTMPPSINGSRQRGPLSVRWLLCAAMLGTTISAFGIDSLTLQMAERGTYAAQPPRMLGEVLLLSIKPDVPARFVGARFANESWKVLHPFALNENGVYVSGYASDGLEPLLVNQPSLMPKYPLATEARLIKEGGCLRRTD